MTRALNTPWSGLGLALAGVLALPIGTTFALDRPMANNPMPDNGTAQLLSRGGGGGGSRGGGGGSGSRGGGGGSRGGGSGMRAGGNSGFSNAGAGLNRGSSRPTGGWSNNARVGAAAGGAGGPSLNRPAAPNRPAAGTRQLPGAGQGGGQIAKRDGNRDLNRDGNRNINRDANRDVNRNVNRNINRDVNRNWNRSVNINNVNVRPGWARPGWGVARPWNYGWYGGWSTPTWGWWGARAAAWGVATLATAAIINDAVDNAVSSNTTYIMVPNTNYQLLYGSVQPSGSNSVSFVMQANGNNYQLTANCNQGTINGQEPSNAEEAELLNAACQVAYGSV